VDRLGHLHLPPLPRPAGGGKHPVSPNAGCGALIKTAVPPLPISYAEGAQEAAVSCSLVNKIQILTSYGDASRHAMQT
jgi:hypothetical protein